MALYYEIKFCLPVNFSSFDCKIDENPFIKNKDPPKKAFMHDKRCASGISKFGCQCSGFSIHLLHKSIRISTTSLQMCSLVFLNPSVAGSERKDCDHSVSGLE